MDIQIKGSKLVIEVDISDKALKSAPPSKTGKTKLVATTNGYQGHGPVKVGLNVLAAK